jgi:hypothetical protein
MRVCLGGRPMKHPARSDFATVVTEAGVSVTFKPTNSTYTFYRLRVGKDVARLGPVGFSGVQHAGRNTGDYPVDEVQAMAKRIASELGASLWSVQERKEADKQSLRGHSIGGDDDVIE